MDPEIETLIKAIEESQKATLELIEALRELLEGRYGERDQKAGKAD